MTDKLKLSDPHGDAEIEKIASALEEEEKQIHRRQQDGSASNAPHKPVPPDGGAVRDKPTHANKIGARKHASFKAISTAPSINLTPSGSGMVPVAYPVVQDLSSSVNVASTVKFNGCPAYLLDASTQPTCTGDAAGTGGGIRSGTVSGEVKPVKGSSTVRIEGKQVIREGDPCTMNSGNNPGVYVTVPAISGTLHQSVLVNGAEWDRKNPLGLDQGTPVEQLATAIRADATDMNAQVQRNAQLPLQKPVGQMLAPWDPVAEAKEQLRVRNNVEIGLLGYFGAPGALTRALGGSEERVAASNEVGAAVMGVAWSVSGIPSRQPISAAPRATKESPTRANTAGLKISGSAKPTPAPDPMPLPRAKLPPAPSPKGPDAATVARIQKIAKGLRPDPSTYLSKDFIDAHLEKFKDGASYLVPKEALDKYGRDVLGRPDNTQFVMTKAEMDGLLTRANRDISIVEHELGIPSGSWKGKEMKRIDIAKPEDLNVRMPTGNESGANDLWIPGGTLPTGQLEAVVNSIPKGKYEENSLWH